MVIESVIEQLWTALENTQEILEELSAFYVEIGDESGKNETFDETETIEKEVQKAIETGQNAIKVRASKTVNINKSLWRTRAIATSNRPDNIRKTRITAITTTETDF